MLIARAILDERLVDLPLNPLFWDLVLDRPVHMEDLSKLDRQLCSTMLQFQEISNKKKEIECDKAFTPKQKKELIDRITYNVF